MTGRARPCTNNCGRWTNFVNAADACAVLIFFLATAQALTRGGRCGHERWAVKTLADRGADKVQLDSPRIATSALPAPRYADLSPRSTAETQVFTVEGFSVGYKLAPDLDFHALKGDGGKSMIIEFPAPGCMCVPPAPTTPRAGYHAHPQTILVIMQLSGSRHGVRRAQVSPRSVWTCRS